MVSLYIVKLRVSQTPPFILLPSLINTIVTLSCHHMYYPYTAILRHFPFIGGNNDCESLFFSLSFLCFTPTSILLLPIHQGDLCLCSGAYYDPWPWLLLWWYGPCQERHLHGEYYYYCCCCWLYFDLCRRVAALRAQYVGAANSPSLT